MPKFVFAYHGGATPETTTEEEMGQVMAAWEAWMGSLGAALTDPGAPAGEIRTVSSDGVTVGGGANPVTGYSLFEGASIDEAAAAAKGCPILDSGGTVEVVEAIQM